jgi:hypothetical protein
MSRRALAYLLAIWTAFLVFGTVAGAATVFPPGMRIGLEPTGDLKVSTNFPGFEDVDRKVAVAILELPASAFGELEKALQGSSQPGLTDVKRESFKFVGGTGALLTARGEVKDVKMRKWVLLANVAEQDLTVMINVELPETALGTYSDAAIRKTLASVALRPTPIDEQMGMLPFKVGDLAGFRVSRVLPTGLIITEGPSDDITKQPYLIVAIGPGGPEQPTDRANFARDMLLASPLRSLTLQSGEPLRIGGLPGYEIRGEAKGVDDAPLSIVQWTRFGGGGYLRIVGVGAKKDWDALFNRFRTVRDSIEQRQR